MINKISLFIDKINLLKAGKIVIFSYFALCLFPYVFSFNSTVYSFFSNLIVHLLLRLIAFLLIACFSVIVFIRLKPKIERTYVGFILFLALSSLVMCFVTQTHYVSFHNNYPYYIFTITETNIGFVDVFAYYLSNLVDLSISVIFVFILPVIVDKSILRPLLLFAFFLMVFECLFSIIFEFNEYISLFSAGDDGYSGYDINISGTFISKNDFGAFLIMGLISERFLSLRFDNKKYLKIILLCGRILFVLITILSLCKTALFSVVVIGVIDAIYLVIKITKNKDKKGLISIGVLLALFLLSIIILISLSANPVIGKIDSFIGSKLNEAFIKSLSDRLMAWTVSLVSATGVNIVFGVPKAILPSIIYINSGNAFLYPHNGFIYQYLCYGIFGAVFLIYVYYLVVKRVAHASNALDKRILLTALFAGFIFMMTETEVLIVSSSELVFVFNVLLCHKFDVKFSNRRVESFYEIISI